MLQYDCIENIFKNEFTTKIIGEALTIIDASGLDREAKKAFKDLFRQCVYRHSGRVLSMLKVLDKNSGGE